MSPKKMDVDVEEEFHDCIEDNEINTERRRNEQQKELYKKMKTYLENIKSHKNFQKQNYDDYSEDPQPEESELITENEIFSGADDDDILEDENSCRICLSNDNSSELISPCLCSGSCEFVHRDCLDMWRSKSVSKDAIERCTTCGFEFKVEEKYQNKLEVNWIRFSLDFVIGGVLLTHLALLLEDPSPPFLKIYVLLLRCVATFSGVIVYICVALSWLSSGGVITTADKILAIWIHIPPIIFAVFTFMTKLASNIVSSFYVLISSPFEILSLGLFFYFVMKTRKNVRQQLLYGPSGASSSSPTTLQLPKVICLKNEHLF